MMKKAIVLLAWLGVVLAAAAQTGAPPASVADQERARINAERSSLEAGFAADEAACYDKFLVNNCIGKVNTRRRNAMADLRRQEILLDDQERKLRAAEQIRKIDEKSSAAAQEAAALRRQQALKDSQERVLRGEQKSLDRADVDAAAKSKADATAGKAASREAEAQARAQKQAGAAEEARKFNERQEQARIRRAENAERMKSKAPARPLPVPP